MFMNRAIKRIATILLTMMFLMAASGAMVAQDPSAGGQASGAQAPGSGDQGPGAAPAATGLDTQSEITENPPLSGLDQPSFEPGFGARSYLAPKAQLSDSVSSNPSASVKNNNGPVREIVRGLGSLDLQKLWKIHPLDVAYIGGASWFQGGKSSKAGWYQIHSMDATQRILWRTGQLAIRDNFSYMPQGSFGFGSFGGAGGFGGPGGGTFGSPSIGTNGNTPRIDNLGMVDITQALTPRSSVTLAGAYGILHFMSSSSASNLINAQQTVGQAGYNYQLTKKDQIAFSYAFQEFHFPLANAGDINVNLWQVYYSHRISGRLNFNVGGGPQWLHSNGYTLGFIQTKNGLILGLVPLHTSRISGAGRVGLTYYWSTRTNMDASYMHYVTPGSGFFPGATTDIVRYVLNHKLTRRFSLNVDSGFSRSNRVLLATSSNNPAGKSHTYDYWYAGGGLRRQLTPHLDGFVSYQYDKLLFGSGFNANGTGAGYGRHVGTIGIDWTPRPIRLD
jgi:hypothetical protein